MAVTPVEAAVGLSIFGSIAAIAIPAFSSNVHASRLVEATDGVEKISASAISHAENKAIADAFPPSVQLTPLSVPRGHAEVDPPTTWDAPTWQALEFRPSPDGVAHWFSFGFDSSASPTTASFVAHAHGDQDGDGLTSTFETRGHDDSSGAVLEPGLYVDKEIE